MFLPLFQLVDYLCGRLLGYPWPVHDLRLFRLDSLMFMSEEISVLLTFQLPVCTHILVISKICWTVTCAISTAADAFRPDLSTPWKSRSEFWHRSAFHQSPCWLQNGVVPYLVGHKGRRLFCSHHPWKHACRSCHPFLSVVLH